MRTPIMFMLCIVLAQKISAQDSLQTTTLQEVVVSGTKFELPVEKSGKIVFKITSKDPEGNAARSLSDVLNQVPGIQMDGNFSSPGANTSYYVRGGRNRHSLILLDGVPMIDPAGIEQFYDLRFLSLDQLENIEVLQGSLSTLYGSGASAGVINLQTRKTAQNGIHGSVTAGVGSWKTFNQSLHLNGRLDKTSFSLMAGNYSSEGFSAAEDNDPATTFDKDGLSRRNLYLNVSRDFTSSFSLGVFTAYDWLDNDFDSQAFIDGTESQVYKQFRVGIKGSFRYERGSVDVVMQGNEINRDERTSYPTKYEGMGWYGEVIHRHQLTDVLTSLSGVALHKLSYGEKNINEQDTTSFTIIDPYTSILIDLPNGLNIHVGVRLNTHNVYGTRLLYNFNPSWMVHLSKNSKIKVLASASTAYITPSLYQLYTTWGGNQNLKPEEDFNVEYGATFYFKDRFQFTAVNYYRSETNAIVYSPSYQYENTKENRYVDGVTLNTTVDITKNLKVSADYAYTHTNLTKTFYRIPPHKAGAGLEYQPRNGSALSVRYQYTGKRTDSYYPNEVELNSFSVVDITASQKFLKNKIAAYVTVANVFDKEFIAVYGYTTRGRNFTAALKYSF